MRTAIRTFAWDSTFLGPIGGWPERMTAVVDTLLLSPVPMASFWGRNGVAIYNDAFGKLLGSGPGRLGLEADGAWPEVADVITAVLNGRSSSVVGRTMSAGGLPLDLDGSPVVGRDGLVLAAILVASMRQAERDPARARTDAVHDAGWSADRTGAVVQLSPGWLALTGLPESDILGDGWMGAIHPDDKARTAATWAGAIATGRPYDIEHRMRTGEGSYRWMRSRAVLRRSPDAVACWQGTTEAVGERKVVENRQALLLGLADRFRAATAPHEITAAGTTVLGREVDAFRVIYAEVDLAHRQAAVEAEWTFHDWDSTAAAGSAAAAGYPRLMPLDPLGFGRVADLEAGMTVVTSQAADGGAGLAVPLIRDGRLRALFHVAAAGPRAWLPEEVGLVEDVATRTWDALERVQATAILRRNQTRQSFLLVLGDRLRELTDSAEVMATTAEAVGRHLHANRAGYGEVTADRQALVFETGWSDGTVEPLSGAISFETLGQAHVEDLLRGLTSVFDVETAASGTTVTAGGALGRDLGTAVAVPLIRDGQLRAVLTLGRADRRRWSAEEIALIGEVAARMWEALERARAETALLDLNATLETRVEQRTAELASSEARFRTLFENAPASIFLIRVGPGGRAVFEAVNAETEIFMGRAATDIVGRDVSDATNPDDPLLARCLECAATGLPVQYEMNVAVDGEARTAESVLAPLAIEGRQGELLIGISRDITAQRRAEDQLRQAQKMEAIGQLTGGIAHDFNNLLTGIIGSLALMQKRLGQGRTDTLERYAGLAMTSANRAAALTHRLLAFSRRQPLEAKPVDANGLVQSMSELLRRTLGESIVLQSVETPGLWLTLCDPHQLENALLNLAINARDAMPDGGRLVVETANTVLDEADVAREPGVDAGQYVMVSVTDTGTGMSSDVIARAFDPFFTTKPLGQGTGLGLSMIYGFVKQSDGHIKIQSEPGQGTNIRIYLPRHRGHDAEAATEAAGAPPRAEQGETVLVVEDNVTVRGLVLEVLQDLGYTALEAPDGPSGLEVIGSPRRIDLLVTDVGLPGMNGRQMAEQAMAKRPGLKVLFITGYAENAAFGNGHLDHDMQMMTKPFAVDALAKRIRAMIQGPRPGTRGRTDP